MAEIQIRERIPGDIGWIIQTHAEVYHQEYGWNSEFECFVTEIALNFMRNFNPANEGCWLAEVDGIRAGSVVLAQHSREVAKLRLLIIKSSTRGLGIGAMLVDKAIEFARSAKYQKVMLWTNQGLDAALHIYKKKGFQMVSEEPHFSFGKNLVSQVWELTL